MRTESYVLAINAGSSSIKFSLYQKDELPKRRCFGTVDRIGLDNTNLTYDDPARNQMISRRIGAPDHTSAANSMIDLIQEQVGFASVMAAGHRIVNGGPKYWQPQLITKELLDELRRISPYYLEHLPCEIELIDLFGERFQGLPQVACFDTAFHHDMPRVAQILPIPRSFGENGIRRYGFHGLSYAFLMEELNRETGAEAAQGRVILAHLGNGASLAAVRGGRSIDTSMGFTPIAGLPMSTRPGDLDPGLFLYLAQTEQMTAKQFSQMINYQSGLLGISEISSDMRDLLKREADDVRAAEAIDFFCYQVKKWIGAFSAALGGLDTLVFSAGIGENSPEVRKRICSGLGSIGVELDEARNAANEAVISASRSPATVRVIHTDEEIMIAKAVFRILDVTIQERINKTDEKELPHE
jgi:acetate kinase